MESKSPLTLGNAEELNTSTVLTEEQDSSLVENESQTSGIVQGETKSSPGTPESSVVDSPDTESPVLVNEYVRIAWRVLQFCFFF